MLNPSVLVAIEIAIAIALALSFLVTYLFNRSFVSFRCAAISYTLFALLFALVPARIESPSAWFEALGSIGLFAAVSLLALGLYYERGIRNPPYAAIGAGATFLAVLIITLAISGASFAVWQIWGVVPTMVFTLWAAVDTLRHTPRRLTQWGYALLFIAGSVLVGVRGFWFADVVANMDKYPSPNMVSLDSAVVMSVSTIMLMLAMAVALYLRAALTVFKRVRQRSMTDALTGLLNRATFDERAARAVGAAARQPICAIVFDIDHFKRVNDTCGHQTGDRVISFLGLVMREATDNRQIAGRIGGEEFAVVLPDSDLRTARLFAEAVRTRFSEGSYHEGPSWTVTLSAGLAMREGDEPMHALLARADKALYAAKSRGRDCVVILPMDKSENVDALRA